MIFYLGKISFCLFVLSFRALRSKISKLITPITLDYRSIIGFTLHFIRLFLVAWRCGVLLLSVRVIVTTSTSSSISTTSSPSSSWFWVSIRGISFSKHKFTLSTYRFRLSDPFFIFLQAFHHVLKSHSLEIKYLLTRCYDVNIFCW